LSTWYNSLNENNVLIAGGTGSQFGLVSSSDHHTASMTAGLVQEYEHRILPSVRPLHTLIFTIMAAVVCSVSFSSTKEVMFYPASVCLICVCFCVSNCMLKVLIGTLLTFYRRRICGQRRTG